MNKKFLAVATFAFAFAFAFTASAATALPMGGVTIKAGSPAMYVQALQTNLNVCAMANPALAQDGAYGPKTTAAVVAFQTSNGGLTIDGAAGPLTQAALVAKCSGTTPTPTPTPGDDNLSGGAGELSYTSTTTSLESDVKEGATENVLASKLEADGSDIAVTSVKVSFENNSGNGSTRLNKYIDEVIVMLGDEEVGSVSSDDFSKDGDVYTKSIALSGAVIDEDEKANLYVAVKVLSTVDEDTADFDGIIEQVRWMDATGAIFSDDSGFGSGATQTFGFDEASVDDDIDIKSSSSDPDAATLLVDADASSEEHMIGVFKLDVDEDSSDIVVSEFPILLTFVASGNTTDDDNADDAENYVEEIRVTVDGEDYTANLDDSEVTDGAGTAVYLIEDEFTIDAGDVVDVKIYATFAEQDGNYGSGATVAASTDETVAENTPDYTWSAEGEDELAVDGSFSGEAHTLSIDDATVDTFDWTVNSTGSIIDFFFTVEAGEEDFDVLAADITESVTGTATITNTASTPETVEYGILAKYSGDSVTTIGTTGFTVAAGDTTTFRVRYTLTTGTNGQWKEVTITSVAGTSVPDDEETSPTATIDISS